MQVSITKNYHEQVNINVKPIDTIEMSFTSSEIEKWRKWGAPMKRICNIFICITQLGFCSVYYLFVGKHVKHVLDYYHLEIDLHLIIAIILVPILITSLIRQLKYIGESQWCSDRLREYFKKFLFSAIFSAIANVCMVVGIVLTISYAVQNLPPIESVDYVASIEKMPLFFGTALFAFEGIALVLPLQNAMKKPEDFSKPFGVLNIGMIFVTGIYVVVGFVGYWKYGSKVEGSLTLNLPTEEM
jgi:solute carrier family 36 (proton-coupled amino acid transporter)